jgi:Glucose dehydrogenase
MKGIVLVLLAVLSGLAPTIVAQNQQEAPKDTSVPQKEWPAYGGGPLNNHYSSLAQIDRGNVKRLQVAWSFDTAEEGGLQTSPLIVNGTLYGLTPTQKVFALDAATGTSMEI